MDPVIIPHDDCFLFSAADIVKWSPNGEKYLIVFNNRIDVYSVEVGVLGSLPKTFIKMTAESVKQICLNMEYFYRSDYLHFHCSRSRWKVSFLVFVINLS